MNSMKNLHPVVWDLSLQHFVTILDSNLNSLSHVNKDDMQNISIVKEDGNDCKDYRNSFCAASMSGFFFLKRTKKKEH